MTANISLAAAVMPASSGTAQAAAPVPGPASPQAPFSRMLDHAVRENPTRRDKPAQPPRPAAKAPKTAMSGRAASADPKPEAAVRPKREDDDKAETKAADQTANPGCVAIPVPPAPVEAPVATKDGTAGEGQELEASDDSASAPINPNATSVAVSSTAASTAKAGADTASVTTANSIASLMTAAVVESAGDSGESDLLTTLTPVAADEVASANAPSPASSSAEMQSPSITSLGAEGAPNSASAPHLDPQNLIGSQFTEIAAAAGPLTSDALRTASTAVQAQVELQTAATPGATDGTITTGLDQITADAAEAVEATGSTPEDVRRAVRAARRDRSEGAETITGIGGAKSSATMKTALKKEELAGGAEQFLPVSAPNALATVRNLPGELGRRLGGPAAGGLEAAGGLISNSSHNGVSADTDALLLRPGNSIARISEIVSREVRMFKRGGDDLVEVVLTPDAKTQISLRLQWRDGQVEVQARCDLGDYQSLSTQWSQLQASLANHGVRLSHLSERVSTGFTEFFNNPGFAQQRGREQQGDQQSAPGADTLPTLANPPTPSGARPVVRRGSGLFDSWA